MDVPPAAAAAGIEAFIVWVFTLTAAAAASADSAAAAADDERAGGFGEGVLVSAETALRELPARPSVKAV